MLLIFVKINLVKHKFAGFFVVRKLVDHGEIVGCYVLVMRYSGTIWN